MHVEQTTYDASSVESILRYARQLEGTTLRDACEIDEVANPRKRRGSFGNALEKYFFHYDINNSPDADFREAEKEKWRVFGEGTSRYQQNQLYDRGRRDMGNELAAEEAP